MTELIKETVTTQNSSVSPVVNTPVKIKATNSETIEYIVYFFFGVLEVLLTFRFILKLTGASISSSFVSLIYGITKLFILPFEGIFRKGFSQGVELTSVFEPATVVAIIVYAVLVWGIIKMIRISSGEQQKTD